MYQAVHLKITAYPESLGHSFATCVKQKESDFRLTIFSARSCCTVSWESRTCSLVSAMSQRLSTTEALNFVFVDDDSGIELFPDGTDTNF